MARVYTGKGLMIYKNVTTANFENVIFEQISYYTISAYTYDGDRLKSVTIEVIIDISKYLEGEIKDVYNLTINHPYISTDVKEDVYDYNKYAPIL